MNIVTEYIIDIFISLGFKTTSLPHWVLKLPPYLTGL